MTEAGETHQRSDSNSRDLNVPGKASFTLRPMKSADLSEAHQLSQAVGWGHRLEDWQLMYELGHGFVASDADGTLFGIAMYWLYGGDFAAIGMVIVSPDLQRSGIGRQLMDAILLKTRGRRLFLNATGEGTRLYESLGFLATGTISTHYGVLASNPTPVPVDVEVAQIRPQDWPAIERLDRDASGMDRTNLLAAVSNASSGLVAKREETVTGYIIPRQFQKGTLLGPLVADSESTASALLSAAAAAAGVSGPLRADIPGDAPLLAEWLERAGLGRVGQVTTMWRSAPPVASSQARIFGLSSQALG